MPTGDVVPDAPPTRPPLESRPSSSASSSEPSQSGHNSEQPRAMTPKSSAITARNNYVSPYRQQPMPARSVSSPIARAGAVGGTRSPNFKDIVNRFNTKQDEKVPNPTNRIPASAAGPGSLRARKTSGWKPNGTDSQSSTSAKTTPTAPPRRTKQPERSLSALGTNSPSSTPKISASGGRQTRPRRSSTPQRYLPDMASNLRSLPPLDTSFITVLQNDKGHRRSHSALDTHSPSAASLADNESEGTHLGIKKSLQHRRSRSNIEGSVSPLDIPQVDPVFTQHLNNKKPSSPRSPSTRSGIPVPNRASATKHSSSAGGRAESSQTSNHTMKNLKPTYSAHGSRHPPQPSKSPQLTAYISAPLPKKSPPLRSSRGQRLPAATTATTAASRQRLQSVQSSAGMPSSRDSRYSRRKGPSPVDNKPKEPRKKIPELGTIDFAARRARIQSAFTKSVEENEEEKARLARRDTTKRSRMNEVTGVSEEIVDKRDDQGEEIIEEGINNHVAEETPSQPHQEDAGTITSVQFVSRESDDGRSSDNNNDPSTPIVILDPRMEESIRTAEISQQNAHMSTPDSVATLPHMEEGNNEVGEKVEPALPAEHDHVAEVVRQKLITDAGLEEQLPIQPSDNSPSTDVSRNLEEDDPVLNQITDADESIAFVVTPVSPTNNNNILNQVSKMLRSEPMEWSPESERSEEGPVAKRAVTQSHSSATLAPDGPEYRKYKESPGTDEYTDVLTPTLSPMVSTATSDDRATIAAVFEQYDEPREDFLKDYTDYPSPYVHPSPYAGISTSKRTEEASHIGIDVRRTTEQEDNAERRASTEIETSTEIEEDGHSYEEDGHSYTSCSEMPDSARPSIDTTSGDEWTTSSDVSPESELHDPLSEPDMVSRPESPTTPRQPIEAETSPLPPTPPPKDLPPPPPAKDAPRASPSIPPSASNTPPETSQTPASIHSSFSLPEIETDPEPLGLAIQSLPSHYDFRPINKRQPTTDRQSLEYFYGNGSARPSLDQYSISRPSIESSHSYQPSTKYSPSSSFYSEADSRRSSAFTGPHGHRYSETPASSMSTVIRGTSSMDLTDSNTTDNEQQKKLKRRRHLMKEIVDTESAFERDMTIAEEIYKHTANACSSITQDDIKVLFGNADAVVRFSKEFLESLKAAVSSVYVMRRGRGLHSNTASIVNSDDSRGNGLIEESDEERDMKTYVGQAFVNVMYRMEKIYGDYCKNHDNAVNRLQLLEKNPGVAIWLRECKTCAEDLTNAWNLESLLIKPVQRILKYPLLLNQLLECTDPPHPDYAALQAAAKEMKYAADRINEMKKRKDMVEKIVGRKRNESDIRHGIQKSFARQAEKLRQSVGLSSVVVDDTYSKLFENYNMHYVQIQVIVRDVELYTIEIQNHVDKFIEFTQAFKNFGDAEVTQHPEIEAKWRKFDSAMREISSTYLQEHKHRVRKHTIEPLETLLKMHESPQRIMTKRNKKAVDYARFKAIVDRGDTPDKKTKELAEVYTALNETLIDELPTLFRLTKKLVDAVLLNFIDLQAQWTNSWAAKLRMTFVELEMPDQIGGIVEAFMGDLKYYEKMLDKLTICNGSLNAMQFPPTHFLSPASTTLSLEAFESSSFNRPRSAGEPSSPALGRDRTLSLTSHSPTAFSFDRTDSESRRHSGGSTLSPSSALITPLSAMAPAFPFAPQMVASNRGRSTSITGPSPAPVIPPLPQRAYTSQTTVTEQRPPMQSRDVHSFQSLPPGRPPPGRPELPRPAYTANAPSELQLGNPRAPSPSPPLPSATFSSAMPMDDDRDRDIDAPPPARNVSRSSSRAPSRAGSTRTLTLGSNDKAMFIAASLYEFNIDKERREAGFPYLTYVQGEIFDVIGIKGEIWLARNQDDKKGEIGWIWCKHFQRLPEA